MSVNSGTLTSRSVHPASPVLLTKNGPLETLIRLPRRIPPIFTFITRSGFVTQTLAHMLDSLVRVSRRVV
ncbi:hypothetical protein Glove_109g28 [Diversispora epigaea]|uniref:Uncharacterized protein n=1 Tax=Diversispora epigaea TaxID=1348612 RepID=A0A397HS58_9GLOM|nr:hypothetical protein Glove_320g147 [Diversispora epigaea]RHZ82472.1 hypothetical protein Glove_109g28 [Diversispora epigaea]